MPLTPGTRLGPYEVAGSLGAGGMGEVYRARDLRVDLERLRRTLTEPATASRAPAVGPRGTTAVSAEVLPSVAVLPFVNMSGDKEQEYFSDGMAEEVINVLSRIAGLKVIARTSAFAFKNRQEDVRTIAGTLGVANILEGSVRKAGNRVRITTQLVTATDGSHLWSERYDRDLTDIFAIQDEIAAAIAGALQVKLSVHDPSPVRRVANPEAYESYLKAIYLNWKLSPDALARARDYLEQAVALDPEFALAHFGLSHHYWMAASLGYLPAEEGMPRAREEARRALEIDPDLPEAHAMVGGVAGSYDFDWREAERHFALAVAGDAVPSNVRQWYAYYYLVPIGRTEEAVAQARIGLLSDPLNLGARVILGDALVNAGRLVEAQAEAHRALEIDDRYPFACTILAFSHALQREMAGGARLHRTGVHEVLARRRDPCRHSPAPGRARSRRGTDPEADVRRSGREFARPRLVLRGGRRLRAVGGLHGEGGGAPPARSRAPWFHVASRQDAVARPGETDAPSGEPCGVTGSSACGRKNVSGGGSAVLSCAFHERGEPRIGAQRCERRVHPFTPRPGTSTGVRARS